jgi:hypothetical protein
MVNGRILVTARTLERPSPEALREVDGQAMSSHLEYDGHVERALLLMLPLWLGSPACSLLFDASAGPDAGGGERVDAAAVACGALGSLKGSILANRYDPNIWGNEYGQLRVSEGSLYFSPTGPGDDASGLFSQQPYPIQASSLTVQVEVPEDDGELYLKYLELAGLVTRRGSCELFDANNNSTIVSIASNPIWARLKDESGALVASCSEDGNNWTVVGTVPLPAQEASIELGAYFAEGHTNEPVRVSFVNDDCE